MPVHAKRQRLHPLQQVPSGLRGHCRPVIPKRHGTHFHGEAEISKGLGEGQVVVSGIWLTETRELVVLLPIEPSRFDNHAAHRVAMPADIFRR